jgi:hypothetical protein
MRPAREIEKPSKKLERSLLSITPASIPECAGFYGASQRDWLGSENVIEQALG